MKKNYLKIPFVKTKNLILNVIIGHHDKEIETGKNKDVEKPFWVEKRPEFVEDDDLRRETGKNKDVEKPFWVERRPEFVKDDDLRRETVNLLNQAFLKALEMEEEDKDN